MEIILNEMGISDNFLKHNWTSSVHHVFPYPRIGHSIPRRFFPPELGRGKPAALMGLTSGTIIFKKYINNYGAKNPPIIMVPTHNPIKNMIWHTEFIP